MCGAKQSHLELTEAAWSQKKLQRPTWIQTKPRVTRGIQINLHEPTWNEKSHLEPTGIAQRQKEPHG